MVNKIKTFLNDRDGLSAREFLMLIVVVPYAGFWMTAMVMDLMGYPVSESFVMLLNQMDGIVMTVVTGVFGLSGIQYGADAYRERSQRQINYNTTNSTLEPTESSYEDDYERRV